MITTTQEPTTMSETKGRYTINQLLGETQTTQNNPNQTFGLEYFRSLWKKRVPNRWEGHNVEHDTNEDKVTYRVPAPKGKLATAALPAISLEIRLKATGYYTNVQYSHKDGMLIGVYTSDNNVLRN